MNLKTLVEILDKEFDVLEQIKKKCVKGSLLVVKHPFDWDGRKSGQGFIHFSKKDYDLMEEMNVSLYSSSYSNG